MAEPPVDDILACIAHHRPGAPVTLERIRTGKFNTSYFVNAGKERLVIRIAPPRDSVFVFYERDMMRQEPEIHALLLDRTTVPVAEILAYDDSLALLPRDYLIMRRLPGTPLYELTDVDMESVLRQTGAALAQVHALQAETYGYIGAHRPMPPQPSWQDAFVLMWRMLIDDVRAVGYYSEDEAAFLLKLLDRFVRLFERPGPACLLHMDVWSQNLLVSDHSELTGIVDWDRALWGDPEIEYAVLDYCGISRPAFWEGYGETRDNSPEAQLRNLFYLLYEIQKYIVIYKGRHDDDRNARNHKQQVMQIARQLTER